MPIDKRKNIIKWSNESMQFTFKDIWENRVVSLHAQSHDLIFLFKVSLSCWSQKSLILVVGFLWPMNEWYKVSNPFHHMKVLELADDSKMQVPREHRQLVGGMCSSRTSWKTSPEYGETPKSSSAKPSTTAKTKGDSSVRQTGSCCYSQVWINKSPSMITH